MNNLSESLREVLEQGVNAGQIAGANVLVLQNGAEIAYAQAGYADIAEKKPYHRDTIARLYSMSKPITAAAVMLLVQRGVIDLGQPVSDFLPSFRKMTVWEDGKRVSARREILIEDLLNMTSGMPYPGEDLPGQEAAAVFAELDSRLYGANPMSTLELAEKLSRCALSFHPGQKWMYGTSADILGAVVEAASGMSFGQFLRENLFAPLGMADTGFCIPESQQHRLAQVYEQTENGMALFETNHLGICYTLHRAPAFESGGAGLISTVDDYAKFAAMLIDGGKGILSQASVDYMTKNGLLPWQEETLWRTWEGLSGFGYSCLMRVMEYPGRANMLTWGGEYGWDGWLGCYFCNSPKNGISVVMTCQKRDAGTMPLTRKLRNVLASSL